MTPLRRRRLLLLAWHGGDCKSFYSQYCKLMEDDPSPVGWILGMAYLTEAGKKELDNMKEVVYNNCNSYAGG